MLTPESITSPTAVKTMTGSTIIYSASSLEEVRKIVESDVYYTAGVVRLFARPHTRNPLTMVALVQWDREKLAITPFVTATPLP